MKERKSYPTDISDEEENAARAGSEGAKRRKGSQVHMAVDTLGHPRAVHVRPADEQTVLKSMN
jgi:hypothetical protein